MDRLQRALDAIDSGLQSSPEHGYGIDRSPELCARCQAGSIEATKDLCAGCRSWLLGDSDIDPAAPSRPGIFINSTLQQATDVSAAITDLTVALSLSADSVVGMVDCIFNASNSLERFTFLVTDDSSGTRRYELQEWAHDVVRDQLTIHAIDVSDPAS